MRTDVCLKLYQAGYLPYTAASTSEVLAAIDRLIADAAPTRAANESRVSQAQRAVRGGGKQ